MTKKLAKEIVALGALLVLLGVLLLLKNNIEVCEFFARTFSRAWIFLFGHIFGWLPFSVYELLLIVVILGAIAFLVLLVVELVKHRWQRLVSLTVAVVLAVVVFLNVYTLSASFAYNRKPLPAEIYTEHTSDEFSFEEAVALTQKLVDDLNFAYANTRHDESGNIVYPFDFNELSDLLAEEYRRLDNDYFSSYTPKGKRILNKWIMSQMHISGVFFAPFGEANVNGYENSLYLPYTLAHEMAHGKGVMREYQADIVALYVLMTSENVYLRYGALAKCASVALSLLQLYPNSAKVCAELSGSINVGVSVERKNYSDFYNQFSLFDDIGEFFNDIYLKLQNQGGTDSYVKPPQLDYTEETDDFGAPVIEIISFSGLQNLLITLAKQNLI